MNQFCQECGKPLNGTEQHCTECGHQINDAPLQVKRPLSKKQKLVGTIVAAVVLLFGVFYYWGNSYVSAQNVSKKFAQAVQENNADALKKVSIIHHGQFISEAEAKALLTLAKEEPGYINSSIKSMGYPGENLFTVVENGRWLGLFKRHSILLTPQYTRVTLPFDGITSTFNGKEFPVKEKKDDDIVYGPMGPGIYHLESSFSGEYTEVKAKEKVELSDQYGDWTPHTVDLDASYVNISLNTEDTPITKAYVKIGDKKINFNKDNEIKKLGPVKLDGKTVLTPVVEVPWGTIESEKIKVKESHYSIQPNLVNDELTKTLSSLLLKYGEEYVQAHAARDVSKFTTISEDMKKSFQSNFQYFRDSEEVFTGKLETIEIDFDSAAFEGHTANLPAKFYFKADFHYTNENADLEERVDHCEVQINFDQKNNKWVINDSPYASSWFDDFTATKTMKGSSKLYSPSNVKAAAVSSTDNSDEIQDFIVNYNVRSVAALNTDDFSMVEDLIAADGPRLKEQRDYLDYIVSKGITEESLSTKVESINKTGENTWEVTTVEEFMIHKPDSSSKKKFRTKNIIKRIDGELQLYELVETKEI